MRVIYLPTSVSNASSWTYLLPTYHPSWAGSTCPRLLSGVGCHVVVPVRRSFFLSFAQTPELPLPTIQLLSILLPLGISSSSGRPRHHVNPPDHDVALVLGESLIRIPNLSHFPFSCLSHCRVQAGIFTLFRSRSLSGGARRILLDTRKVFSHLHPTSSSQGRAHTTLWADLTCLRLLSWSVRCILGVFVLS